MTNKEIITAFLQKMSTQPNRCTAFPIYFVIRTAEWVITEEGYGDDRVTYVAIDDYEDTLTQEEWEKLPETEDDLTQEQRDSIEQADQMTQEDYKPFYEKKIWKEDGMFLTETDAEWSLKARAHHFSSDAHTYVKCAHSAPELREFLIALFAEYNIPPRLDPGTM